jgi:hypothetical protein
MPPGSRCADAAVAARSTVTAARPALILEVKNKARVRMTRKVYRAARARS